MKKRRVFRQPKRTWKMRGDKEKRKNTGAGALHLFPEMEKNISYLKGKIGKSNDVIFREYVLNLPDPVPIYIIFVDGLVSKEVINEYILQALTFKGEQIGRAHV